MSKKAIIIVKKNLAVYNAF